MKPALIDTHSHLHFPAYDNDRDAVLLSMEEERIWTIAIGTNARTSQKAIDLAKQNPSVFASVGYHPGNLTSVTPEDIEEQDSKPYDIETMKRLAISSDRVVAIGEVGLDFYHIDPNLDPQEAKERQRSVFIEQITLANQLDLPVIIHCREAFDELIQLLQDLVYAGTPIKGVVHCFGESWQRAQALLDLGLHLSFTGIITFKPRKSDDPEEHVHRVIERMPLDQILIETDAPWLAPEPNRGKRNEPAYVSYVADKIAELRGEDPIMIRKKTTESAIRFFGLERFAL